MNIAGNEEWEVKHVIEDNDEKFDPLYTVYMEEGVDSESESQNGMRGVGIQDPSLRIKELCRQGRDKEPRGNAKQRIFAPRTNPFYNNCLRVNVFG